MSTNAAENVQKYLLFFSYLGKRYNGLQLQTRRVPIVGVPPNHTDNSIQLHLENALKTLRPKPVNEVIIGVSSRTDKGVNALVNTCQFHLKHPLRNCIYMPNSIIRTMNEYLMEEDHSVIVRRVVPVHNLFCSRRHILSRTYVYRIAVIKKPEEYRKLLNPEFLLPIDELHRCWPVCPTKGYLDIEKMRELCDVFVGTHNFNAFQAPSDQMRNPERTIFESSIKLIPESFLHYRDAAYKNIDLIEIIIKGKSFLYKQVRRMVGVLIAVGRGGLDVNSVRSLLNDPENNQWRFITAPPSGLYLTDVEYDEKDFCNPRIFNPKLLNALPNEANATETETETETVCSDLACETDQTNPRTVECN